MSVRLSLLCDLVRLVLIRWFGLHSVNKVEGLYKAPVVRNHEFAKKFLTN